MPVIPASNYSTGVQVHNLIKDLCNDPQGQLYSPAFCIQAINSAARWIGRELRNRGKMTLVEDEWNITVPQVNVKDPTLQVNVTFTGQNGNLSPANILRVAANDWDLPNDLIEPLVLLERPAGQNTMPSQMRNRTGQGGLPRRWQHQHLGEWEWRTDMIALVGALVDTEIIIRYNAVPIQFSVVAQQGNTPPYISGSLGDIDGIDACAYYAASQLIPKHGGTLGPQYRQEAETLLEQIATDVTRQQQFSPTRMRPYGSGSRRGFGSRYL